MATNEEKTFLHELEHAAHYRIDPKAAEAAPSWRKEIIAGRCRPVRVDQLLRGRDDDRRGPTGGYLKLHRVRQVPCVVI